MSVTSISDALFTKSQQKVLGLLYAKPDKSFYTNEIMRWASMGRGTISRELDKLVASGLLTVTRTGNQNHYQADSTNPVYNELVSIVKKTFGFADEIREAMKPVYDQINWAFIYGSVAKGNETSSSDIDLLVTADSLAYTDLMTILTPIEQTLSRPINPSIYTNEQIKSKLKENNAFITRVMEQPKIWIKGNDNDIRVIRQFSKN